MGGYVIQKNLSHGRTCLIEEPFSWEDMSYWKTFLTGGYVLQDMYNCRHVLREDVLWRRACLRGRYFSGLLTKYYMEDMSLPLLWTVCQLIPSILFLLNFTVQFLFRECTSSNKEKKLSVVKSE